MKTFFPSGSGLRTEGKRWILIDAKGLVLGRLAAHIVHILKGKNKAYYTPYMDCGDNIVVVNCADVVIKGRERARKRIYYRHTGYMGGIKSKTAQDILEGVSPENLLLLAVKRMNSIGPLARQRLRNLHLYAGSEHKNHGQTPELFDFGSLSRKNKIVAGYNNEQ